MTNKIIYQLGNDDKLTFITDEKLFSPKGADKGTLAMLRNVKIKPNDKVLDLGCGYGFVGIYLAKAFGLSQITMCDVDPNAVLHAKKNAELNSVNISKIIVSDGLSNIEDKDYTLILSNPPYHTDFNVAKRFIEQGHKSLAIGGRMAMVVKRLLWYKNKLTSVFGGVRVVEEQDGYYILIAEKRSHKKPPKKEKKTNVKHQKRMEKSKKRKRKA